MKISDKDNQFIKRELGYLEGYDSDSQIPPDSMTEYAKLIEQICRREIEQPEPDEEYLYLYAIVSIFASEEIARCFNKEKALRLIETQEKTYSFVNYIEEYYYLNHEDAYVYTMPIIKAHFEHILLDK